jgi:predicted phosphodiesterase
MDRIGRAPAAAPMAFLSDLHGNLRALQAVLAELDRRAITDVLIAGDLLLGGEQPMEVWTLLQQRKARCTRGPSDVALATVRAGNLHPDGEQEAAMAERFAETQRAVGELVLRRLAELPEKLRVPMIDGRELLMVHGSPADPLEALSHDMPDAEALELLGDDPADIVICGATHVPFERIVDDVQVVNVGSVGQAPEGGVAHFTILRPKVSGAEIEQTWVELD